MASSSTAYFCPVCRKLWRTYDKRIAKGDRAGARRALERWDSHRDVKHGAGRPVRAAA